MGDHDEEKLPTLLIDMFIFNQGYRCQKIYAIIYIWWKRAV